MSVGSTRRRDHIGSSHAWPPGSLVTLAALLGLLIVGSLQGGAAMVINPVDPLGMSPDYLIGTPVSDYFWPGLFLVGIAVVSMIAIPGLLFDWRWSWASRIESAIGFRWPWLASVAIGAVLLVFELIELFIVPFHPVMHPLLIGWSIAIVGFALTPSARAHLRVS